MSPKIVIFLIVLVIAAGLMLWSGGSQEKDTPAPRPELSAVPKLPPDHPTVDLPRPPISRAVVAVQGPEGEDLGIVNLIPHSPAALPGTDYKLNLTDFYTHWTWDRSAKNLSYSERNPSAKIEVFSGDSLIYYQWAFRDMPFFRRGSGGRHDHDKKGTLAFALTSYENVSIPSPNQRAENNDESI